MSFKSSFICAASVLSLMGASAHAGLIKSAGKASTSNTTTTTPGQHSILMTVDPFSVSSFKLDVSFEANKVQFVSIVGLNGFIIDDDFSISTVENSGLISNIHGYFPGFNDRNLVPIDTGGEFAPVPGLPPGPPVGEVNIFQITFTDFRPDLDKTFGVFASPTDYINGFDPQTGGTTQALGPVDPNDPNGLGVAPAFSTVPGIPGGGGNAAPLPGALVMGLLGGTGVLVNFARRRKA